MCSMGKTNRKKEKKGGYATSRDLLQLHLTVVYSQSSYACRIYVGTDLWVYCTPPPPHRKSQYKFSVCRINCKMQDI